MDDETLILKTQIEMSRYRPMIMKCFDPGETIRPKRIAEQTGLDLNYVSRYLRELREMDLVYVLNPNVRANRDYKLTEKGEYILPFLD